MFDIKYSKQAVKFLKSLDKKLVSRILIKIEKLREPAFVVKPTALVFFIQCFGASIKLLSPT
jgi:mRNA-degrading endonuclease RelE of RelBE toxin-antitoxin system